MQEKSQIWLAEHQKGYRATVNLRKRVRGWWCGCVLSQLSFLKTRYQPYQDDTQTILFLVKGGKREQQKLIWDVICISAFIKLSPHNE